MQDLKKLVWWHLGQLHLSSQVRSVTEPYSFTSYGTKLLFGRDFLAWIETYHEDVQDVDNSMLFLVI